MDAYAEDAHYRWQLLAEFEYHVGGYPSDTVIRVPAMTVLGVSRFTRTAMYWAVRWFGRGNYRQ